MRKTTRAFQQLIENWQSEFTPLELGVSPDKLKTLFASHGFHATQDVIDLYSLTGGMKNGHANDRMFELWCLDRLDEENGASKWDFLWFGDWLISSHLYALQPVDEGHSAVYIDYQCDRITPPQFLAESLYEFAERLVSDPTSMGVIL